MKYGEIVIGKVTDENVSAYYVQVDGVTFELDKALADETYHLGDEVEGMIYENRNGKKVMQTELPLIRPNVYGWGEVTAVRKDLGVFVDIGLQDKDVVLSLDLLPDNTQLWPKKSDKLYITYEVDTKNRFWAKLADYETMAILMKKASEKMMNQSLEVTIFQVKLAGGLAISQEGYRVFIHESEQTQALRIGQQMTVRVIKVAKDGTLNASMKPRAHEAISDDAAMILALLNKQPKGFLGLHDKSDPQLIQNQLGISKAQFKRAVGQLLKNKQIRQEKDKGLFLL